MRPLLALLAALLVTPPLGAALASPPHENVHFVTEHLPESAQDARWLALPWPAEEAPPGGWRTTLAAGYVSTTAGFWRLDGPTVSAGAAHGINDRWGLVLLGFYDRLSVGGDGGVDVLDARFLHGVPLDLPERAAFSDPRGTVTHLGLGVAATRALGRDGTPHPWTLAFGVVFDRLEVQGLRADYRLLGGADAGAEGVLDHSSTADFATPLVEIQRWRPLGERWALVPRVLAGAPLPPGNFDGRLAGSGFDLSTARGDGSPGRIGDAFAGLGLGIEHRPSGLEIDLGSTLFYPLFERVTHAGVDRAVLMQVAWHSR